MVRALPFLVLGILSFGLTRLALAARVPARPAAALRTAPPAGVAAPARPTPRPARPLSAAPTAPAPRARAVEAQRPGLAAGCRPVRFVYRTYAEAGGEACPADRAFTSR